MFISQYIFCQNPINVVQSNQLDQIIVNDTTWHKFSGNVIIEHLDFKIKSDTIIIDEFKTLIKGWGNTEIINDSISCKSDSITIKKLQDHIVFYNNTILKTNGMTIYSNQITYDYKNKKLNYYKGGNIKSQNQNIESQVFVYHIESKKSYFSENINLKTQDFIIQTDIMHEYNDTIEFLGMTNIKNSELDIYCNEGLLKKSTTLILDKGVEVQLEKEVVQSKKLTRDIQKNINYFTEDVKIITEDSTYVFGNELTQFDNISTITKKCKIKLLNNTDSIIITGDSIIINNQNNTMQINSNVIINGQDLYGSCDIMTFESNYNKINMLIRPVLFFNQTQLTGETIALFKQNNQLDSLFIPKEPFIRSPNDSLSYDNQIKGNFLEGKLKEKSIDFLEFNGNSKMKYFDNNIENKTVIGINNIEAGKIKILFNNSNNIKSMLCINQVESNHIEIDTTKMTMQKIKELTELDGYQIYSIKAWKN